MIYRTIFSKFYKIKSCYSNDQIDIESDSSHSIKYYLNLKSNKIYRNKTCSSFYTRPIFQSF
ncbi:hypothetical protein RB653_002756 [Dictyostelium firmibasis]|uniref:Uncharacterized protein n=1 Tax=Dictyostelium firmibasis TaxID=79012 RepID=A0AAN7TYC7_9MYCE